MATGQPIVSACLLAAAAISALLLLLFRAKDGKVALSEDSQSEYDPFDVPPADDAASTHAVDGGRYKSRVSVAKQHPNREVPLTYVTLCRSSSLSWFCFLFWL